jgi:protein SCO1/2
MDSLNQSLSSRLAFAAIIAISVAIAPACNRAPDRTGAYDATDANDCLPDITLLDQNGAKVSLASLKGKPALFGFIYTSCPGPCLMLTSKMELVAKRLGPLMGSKVRMVSVSVDPEHDKPAQLLDYAKQQGVDQDGWLFLTGAPQDVDRLMARFKLIRQHEPDGTVDHVAEFFLVGADGHQLYQYVATSATPTVIAHDMEQAAQNGTVTGEGESPSRAHL